MNEGNQLLFHLDKLHTTELGAERIQKNLGLAEADPVLWCREEIVKAGEQGIIRQGKNWYVQTGAAVITVNARSYTIITARKGKIKPQRGNTVSHEKEELREALRAIESTIHKCEKALPKLKQGTPQHTLLSRRIKAFQIALSLIKRELQE